VTKDLIKTPTDKLLQKFGSGSHKPGSGSAAALLSLLSCKLIQTVGSLTSERASYEDVQETLSQIMSDLAAGVEPEMVELFHLDSVQFDRVITARRARNAEHEPLARRRLAEKALVELRDATETPLRIAELSIRLCEYALTMFDMGFRSARGDSVVAITSSHAAAGGALAIVYLNLASFRGSYWAVDTRRQADALSDSWESLGTRVASSLMALRREAISGEAAPR
jgi:formiminotetrahydrofolate cyclodeaminase